MEKKEEYTEIDLLQLFKALWHKAWAIILAMVIAGGLAFGYTQFLVTPLYKARTYFYVNNNSTPGGNTASISQSDLNAAQSLVDTYSVILKTRATLDDVIKKADLHYTYEELVKMISATSVNSTEVFCIEVTSPNPNEAQLIANTIGEILPEKISSIVEGSSVRIVESAVVPTNPSSPNLPKNVILGMLLGMILACGIVIVRELTDRQIHDPDYLLQTYNIPVLAVIPDLSITNDKHGYYKH